MLLTTPSIIFRMRCHPGFNRIQMNISACLQKVSILFYQARLISVFKQMSSISILSIIGSCIITSHLMHDLPYLMIGCFYQQMNMIRHQAICMDFRFLFFHRFFQYDQKYFIVHFFPEYFLSSNPSLHQMIDCPWIPFSLFSSYCPSSYFFISSFIRIFCVNFLFQLL